MPRTDFSKYRTYKWVNIGDAHPDQIMDAEIKQAVDSQLAAKGMSKTDSDNADLYIGSRPPSIRKHNGMSKAREPSAWAQDRGLVRRSVPGPSELVAPTTARGASLGEFGRFAI